MGIKDWFGGDKKKQAYRDKVKEAVSDGKLSSTDMQELAKLRQELDVTDAADDKTSLRRDLYNEAVDAARSKGQLTQTGLQDLQKIQKFLALRDDQVEKTKFEVNRLRTLTEIRKGNLPLVPPTNVALRGMQMESGEVPHYNVAVEIMDQPRVPTGSEGMKPSQTPDPPRSASGTGRFPQSSKSPITSTDAALGAQTANSTPSTFPRRATCAPSWS